MKIMPFPGNPGAPKAEKPPFEQVFDRYYTGVLNYVMKKTGNREDAEDLTSEIFLYCYRSYDSYDPSRSAVSTWLYLAASSRIKNYYRDHQTFTDLSDLENVLEAAGTDMERAVWLEQLRAKVAEAILTLPERQQKAVKMRYFENRTSEEIAAELNITAGNARVLLSRALDKLSVLLTDFMEYNI